ncbi:MAG: M23 family metallopeptidase [Bacteroidales bacterium]|nr:M23 family metallopeptidase [Bacteroidales bacterium]
MSKQKYVYNHKTLSYERFEEPTRKRVGRVILYLVSTAVFALVFILLFYTFFGSPKEKAQAREIEFLKLQYEILDNRMDQMNTLLADLEQRDDNVYRVIFEADPIPSSVRKAGFGGSDRYEHLYGYKNSDIVLHAARKLDQVASQLYVQSKSYDEVFALAKGKAKMLACIPAIIPLKQADIRGISSYFGNRPDPIYKVTKFHSGIDFAAALGTEVFVTGDGVVEKVEQNYWGYGNLITVNHGYGYKTQYAHLSKFGVVQGQKVKRGQVIGYVGSTGKSTGSHLHYEVLQHGEATDPMHFFFDDLTPEEYETILKQAENPSITMD